MSDDIDLAELLGVDREVARDLAETSSAIAQARAPEEVEQSRSNREWQASWSGQTPGAVNLASLNQAHVAVLQTATLATQAAVNMLVIDRAREARELFRLASTLVEPYSSNDAAVLATCADPLAAVSAESDASNVNLAPWVFEAQLLLRLASGSDRSTELFGAMATPRGLAGAGSSTEPPAGVSLATLIRLRVAISSAMPGDGPRTWNGLAEGLDALLSDASSPLDEVVEAEWWANQTGSLFPLEPEVLMLGLSGAVWRRRRAAFGVTEGTDSPPGDRVGSRLAFAVSAAADRLVSDQDDEIVG